MAEDENYNDFLSQFNNYLDNEASSENVQLNEKSIEEEEEVTEVKSDEESDSVNFYLTEEEIENDDEEIEVEKYLEKKELFEDKDENEEEESEESEEDDEYNDIYGSDNENDKEYLDVNDEALLLKNNGNEGISFNELSDDGGDDENADPFDFPDKKSFDEVNAKKKFVPGRLNKNNMLIAIAAFMCVIFAGFLWASSNHEKKLKEQMKDDDGLSVGGYQADFGNYKERGYKPTEDEEPMEKLNEILLEGEKEPYEPEIPEQKPVNTAPAGSAPVNNTYQERVESPLRKGINPYENGGYGYSPSGNNDYPQYTDATYNNPSAAGDSAYFDSLNNLTASLKGGNGSGGNDSGSLRYSDAGRYNPNAKGGDYSSIPPNSIYPGTIIPAVMVNGINTDYPGTITARVISNVYDSRTGRNLLIPSGSILRGSYSSSSIGISRIQIAWQTLIINRDGMDYMVNLGSMVGVDARGYSGIKGSLNDHYFAYLKAAGISCLFTFINSNIFTVTNAQKSRTTQQMISDSQEIGNKLADKILDRALDIQPTVTVKPGARVNVDVAGVLTLAPYERDVPKQRYIRGKSKKK